MPVTPSGYLALRAEEFIQIGRDRYEAVLAENGYAEVPDWDRDLVLGQLTGIMGLLLGTLSEDVQQLADNFDDTSATGVFADNLAALVGVTRKASTFSQAQVQFGGDPGTVIPAGKKVRGGGIGNQAVWSTDQDYEIGGGGTVDAVVIADVSGPTVALISSPSAISSIVTPVAGWETVEQLEDASVGSTQETDGGLYISKKARLSQSGSTSTAAIRAELLKLSFVQAAEVIDNDENFYVELEGIVFHPHSYLTVVYPDDLTLAQKKTIAETIYRTGPAGIYSEGYDEEFTVTTDGADGKVIRYSYAVDTAVTVEVELRIDPKYTPSAIIEAVENAILDYFSSLIVGQDALILEIQGIIDDVKGVLGIDLLLLNGVNADIESNLAQRLTLVIGDLSVTIP